MTQKPNRRILTFPAVHTCEGVSPDALLHALIAVGRAISNYRLKSLSPYKRIAREAIREIEIFLVFLEDVRDRRSPLSDSAILCFSEIYVSFQKIQFLLEDCAHEGARIWMLMQSERVIDEFHISIRSFATALDVLPLALMDVSTEARELVELLVKQARKVEFEIDPSDERAATNVRMILGQFEKKFVPNSTNLKRVFDHLGIKNWSECNKEIKFLEEEMVLESADGTVKEAKHLSSLMGLMNYCRGILFDVVDNRNTEHLDIGHEMEGLECLNPEDFRCPITLELMTDPVIIATGQTYDRASIQKWLKSGNLTCPKTGEKLKNTELIPNSALHRIIQQFCHHNGITNVEPSIRSRDLAKTHFSRSHAEVEAMRMLSIFLVEQLSTGSEPVRNKAAYEIRLLTKSNMFNRGCLVEAGAVLCLLELLSSKNSTTQDNTVAALLNLSKHSKGKTVIFESGGLNPILDVLRKGLKVEARQNAAATLFYLASVDEYREAIGETQDAIPALVELLRDGTSRGKRNAAVAIFSLLLYPVNHQRAIAAGAIPSLVRLLKSERADVVNDSIAVLATLAEKPEGSNAILKAMEITSLVGILHSTTSRAGKEHCIAMLLSLCINGGAEVVSDLRKSPTLMKSLYSLITEGSSRSNKKANLLFGVLHDFHNQSPSNMFISPARQEHIVHVR